MKIKNVFVLLILSVFFLSSCQKKKVKSLQPGVIISFDDAYIDEWFTADSLMKKYNWKATFCVCRIDSIGKPQLNKLIQLKKEGHEIAGHGYHHYNAVKFVAANGINEYIKQEIDPMNSSMKRLHFNVTSFAYPYGERSDLLDSTLTNKFSIIRGRAFCGNLPEKEGCYFNNSKFVYAFDIDNSHIHFSIPYLLDLLDYAQKNNKILVLCSHKPVIKVTENYQTKMETLEFLCKYMKLNHLKFYTLSDLDSLVKDRNKKHEN